MSIHHEVVLPAPPARIYEVLTSSAKFTAATGGRVAEIGTTEGAAFSLFGGPIHGRHVELVDGERVVQAWRVKNWEAGLYSVVRFTLKAEGTGTRLVLDHDGYPPDQHDHLSAGWTTNYLEPLAKV